MRLSIPVLVALAALALPAASSAAWSSGLVLVADGPAQLGGPTAPCPLGTATATVMVASTGEQAASTACAMRVAPCGHLCQRFRVTYEVPLAAGTIRTSVSQRQVSSPDGLVVGVTLQGRVARATGAYAELRGARVNGGGAFFVQPDGSVHLNLATAIAPVA